MKLTGLVVFIVAVTWGMVTGIVLITLAGLKLLGVL